MDFVDPHFHYWDITPPSPSGHDKDIIKNPAQYTPVEYIKDMSSTGLTLKKAVFIEALSNKPLEEANWVRELIKTHETLVGDIPHRIVAYADLTQESKVVEELLAAYAKNPLVVGIRQILNHHPENPLITWPKVSRDYLHDDVWAENYALLGKYNFSFDFQGNPHQYISAAKIFEQHSNIPVVVDHLGTLYLRGDEDINESLKVWKAGVQALAKLPHVRIPSHPFLHAQVYMKLSMLSFICKVENEQYPSTIRDLVLYIIALFGSERCMFASNYPVDKPEVGPKAMYDQFQAFVADKTDEERQNLFFTSANKFYKF